MVLMQIFPKDNRESTKSQSSSRKALKKRNAVARYGLAATLFLTGILLLVMAITHTINLSQRSVTVQEKPISDLLNMADHHQLKSVTIDNTNDVVATGLNGQQYHALKEDGQSVTEILRRDGVTVSIDNGQQTQWAQGLADVLLIALLFGGMYFFIRRSGMNGQAMSFSRSKA